MATLTKRSKRLKGEPVDEALKLRESAQKSGDQPLSPDAEWNQLPYEILLQVFHYLDDNSDKYHAALTCKSWLRPLSAPSIWRTGDFRFTLTSVRKALEFVMNTGKTLRHIRADCPESKDSVLSSSTHELYLFLAHLLNAGNKQLLTLRLTNISRLKASPVHQMSDVVKLLALLLQQQQQLRSLHLSNALLTLAQGQELLSAASQSSCNTLQTLAVDEFVSPSFILNASTYLANSIAILCGFRQLSELEVSYSYLVDDVLLGLAQSANTNLQLMTVCADDDVEQERQTTPEAWQSLGSACPDLKVKVVIQSKMGSYFDRSLLFILTQSMPLYALHWNTGPAIAIANIKLGLNHVATHFQNSLHYLKIESGVRIDDDSTMEMFESLHQCKQLETLTLSLVCNRRTDEEMYKRSIRAALARSPMSCSVQFNGQDI
ncbi:F-box/LRR-repeat protein 21-like [Physella acuta]|uniref:F-box/LRR-repeat protein 21-like n=1 Tax=Physella acuta TaxID=109671 RepID=UPI0027DAC363|nr:F-box/LRR-repeat protein 21-like [Physella acuta]